MRKVQLVRAVIVREDITLKLKPESSVSRVSLARFRQVSGFGGCFLVNCKSNASQAYTGYTHGLFGHVCMETYVFRRDVDEPLEEHASEQVAWILCHKSQC